MATTAVQEKHVEHGANNPINYENKNGNEDDIESGTKDGNPGWADAMARILTKQIPEDKPVVLSKYKKVETERKQKQEEILKQKLITQEKHEAREKNHVKPAPSNDEKERNLKRIATKGVVKLFNAVNKHQEDLDVKLKSAPTEAKKVKVMKSVSKSSFLDMLKHDSSDVAPSHQQEETKKDGLSRWNILKDDFMIGGTMKDWDKDDMEYEDEVNQPVDDENDEYIY